MVVRADRPWTDTGVWVERGEPIAVEATGTIQFRNPRRGDGRDPLTVGPRGTYFWSDDALGRPFPLPAADQGPAPTYCLIARIGAEGPPLYAGNARSWIADRSGPLQLGINDYEFSDNRGAFRAIVRKPSNVSPVTHREIVTAAARPGHALPGASVVVFYVDGLRPDVVEEMAAMGHLPNLRHYFLEGGTRLANSVTVFPSNTITSNGSLWTGRFSDRHGIKSQTRFSRRLLEPTPHLDPLGPNETAKILRPEGIDGLFFSLEVFGRSALTGRESADRWRRSQTTDTPAIYDYLRRQGMDWASGILPITPETPPGMWTRHVTNSIPYFGAHRVIYNLDAANATFALDDQLPQNKPVTIVWLPDVDTHSHHMPRGQFGRVRRTLAKCDLLIGRCIEELRRNGRLEHTYLMVVSDHGHTGGRHQRLARYDLAHELFYEPRLVTRDRQWVGGGLGLSVRQHREWHRHSEDGRKEFVFMEAGGTGCARIFLPKGHYRSGVWMPPNSIAELMHYRLDDHLPPINLIDTLTQVNANTPDGPRRPVDLVLAKLGPNEILVANAERGWAVIERRPAPSGGFRYRYQVIENYTFNAAGDFLWSPRSEPTSDPLWLLEVVSPGFLNEFHDEQTWLEVTVRTAYPDSVVALSRHMLWDPRITPREEEYAPDLVVTAAPGWQFGEENEPGTSHGHPLRDTMFNTWLVAGPNVRRGAIVETPCRAVDVLPTILEMVGVGFQPEEMDGHPLRLIYETAPHDGGRYPVDLVEGATPAQPRGIRDKPESVPLAWSDFDLGAWAPLPDAPRPEYPIDWPDVHRYDNPWDLHNVFNDLTTLSQIELVRVADDLIHAVAGKRPGLNDEFDRLDARLDSHRNDNTAARWVAEGNEALQLRHLAFGDFSYTSEGNWKRANSVIDWVQYRYDELDHGLATPLRVPTVVGAPVANRGIDAVQNIAEHGRQFLGRAMMWLFADKLINGLEDGIGAVRYLGKRTPAERVIEPGYAVTGAPEPGRR